MATAAYVGPMPPSTNRTSYNVSTGKRALEESDSPETNTTNDSQPPDPFDCMSPGTLDRNIQGAKAFMRVINASVQSKDVMDDTEDSTKLTEDALTQHEENDSSDIDMIRVREIELERAKLLRKMKMKKRMKREGTSTRSGESVASASTSRAVPYVGDDGTVCQERNRRT